MGPPRRVASPGRGASIVFMAETEATLAEQLAEIRAQLDWVRDYL
jgi:hypothetical protein